jgi:hypothetical protein
MNESRPAADRLGKTRKILTDSGGKHEAFERFASVGRWRGGAQLCHG